ncbi:MAG: S-methyl-5-thioribose-1-phosphate isomerase [Gemmatimonadota bacterium]|nr:MAG: S-methyl-5-thioribose-1-phosphate isomerase [Gemmatimonadota bacterium]
MTEPRTPRHPTPLRWTADGRGLVILDQTELPERVVDRELRTVEEVAEAIRSLRVRGAPLIGITAATGVAALARGVADRSDRTPELAARVADWCDRLEVTRPTAINLKWALVRMRAVADGVPHLEPSALADALSAEAQAIWDEDREMCRRIGEHGLELLSNDATVLTHCNAGALATGGIGTALAPIYLAHEAGRRVRVFADETRPLLQGSRLTAWELGAAGVDVTVIPDNAAAALFAHDPPDVVLVGADRIAANGDVANKVGTYGLAVLANHHGVPIYVLAPTSTIDPSTPTGTDIPIEERDPDEVRRGFGRLTAPADVSVWSPAFDVTPGELLEGIITEHGVARAPFEDSLAAALAAAVPEQ